MNESKLKALTTTTTTTTTIIIIMYSYHAFINALSTVIIHINLSIFYTHVEHSPTKTIYIRYYMETHTLTHTHTHSHTHTDAQKECNGERDQGNRDGCQKRRRENFLL